ncbi:unnamed protein product [Adineta steineri]|uniref:Lipocalin/cytosolic fatty-acid binding domain-containing protein n=2 Tax=Adineta steineri TaxID=433720 RepID=A0A819WLX0_9BILA|nr:unnamed protein product [Adineta steineri]
MASTDTGMEKFRGAWGFVNSENFDECLREMGISWIVRQAAKAVTKEKMTISTDDNGKWTVKSESTFKTTVYEFTLGVEFDEVRADGAEVKSTITYDNETDRWIHDAIDKQGRKVHLERYIDDEGQQQVEFTCDNVKARRWYKSIE